MNLFNMFTLLTRSNTQIGILLFISILVGLLTSNSVLAQDIELKTAPGFYSADTIRICSDSVLSVKAIPLKQSAWDETTVFYWYFGDGLLESGEGLDSVGHKYTKGGGYFVRLEVFTPAGDTLYASFAVAVSLTPFFTGSSTSVGSHSICYSVENADTFSVKGLVKSDFWKYEPDTIHTFETEVEITAGKPFVSQILHEAYPATKFFTSGSEIDSVVIELEHSEAADLEIRLNCPNGNSVQLKPAFHASADMGEPVDIASNLKDVGKYYRYVFTAINPDFDSMKNESGIHTHNYKDVLDTAYTNAVYLPQGKYLPEEDFNKLAGCPYNGNWTLSIIDNNLEHNGFIKSWGLFLHDPTPVWTISHTYNIQYWEATTGAEIIDGINLPNAIAKADLEDVEVRMFFKVTDNYACSYDTMLTVTIEKAGFTASPPGGVAELSVKFEKDVQWRDAGYYWDFGDGKTADLTDTITHIYMEKGNYKVVFTAISASGCINTDTFTIVVTAPVSSINAPNAFSPNSDGFNDRFSVKFEGMRSIELAIFSRNGLRMAVLEGKEAVELGWDGSIGNDGSTIAPPGIYYFHIRGEGLDDKKYNQRGYVHLFR